MVRIKRRRRPDRRALERFFQARDALARNGLGAPAEGIVAGLDRTRVWDFLTRLGDDDRSIPPPLEPLLPALAETVLFWSGGTRQVLVIHDEQSALTAGRLSRLQQVLADGAATSPLAGLVMVDSRDDPRVQVADLLAGAARRHPDRRRRPARLPDLTARPRCQAMRRTRLMVSPFSSSRPPMIPAKCTRCGVARWASRCSEDSQFS